MPELVLALISIVIALPGAALTAWLAVGGARDPRPDPLEESAAAQRAAITAADTARASARAANTAELAAFDAEARRILDVLDVPCVCSQVSTHEWDERTQTYRQRWTVPEHFTSCAKHWPATTGAPPPGTIADRGHEGGQLTTPAARVDAERERSRAERQRSLWAGDGDYTIARAAAARAPILPERGPLQWEDGEDYKIARWLAATSTTTYGVPADCTCVPAHAHAALANTHVVHRVGCATNRGPHAAEWRPVRDNG